MKMLHLIAIGFAKQALVAGSREQKRMEEYAKVLNAYHLIVLTRVQDKLPESYVSGNLHVHATHARTRIGMLFAAYRIGRRILKEGGGAHWVVSSQDPFETSIVGRALTRTSRVDHHVQLHGDFYGSARWVRESLLNRLRAWYGLFVLKRATKIRVVSKRIQDSLSARGIPPEKTVVLPIAVSLEKFLTIGDKRPQEHKTACTFVFVGRLAPEKNLTTLLQAFAKVAVSHKKARLRIIGDGPERPALEDLVRTLHIHDVVTFVPWTENVPGELSVADAFVLPSFHEGHALVLIEAMAAGLPLITTDVGCVGTYVTHAQEGLVVAPTVASMCEAMETFVEHPALRITYGQAALQRAHVIAHEQDAYIRKWKESFIA